MDPLGERLSFGILGPLEVWRNGTQVPLGAAKRRALLSLLLVRRSDVSRDVLIDALWGERPPAGARNTLQVYVSSLRRELGRGAIETTPTGYRMHLNSGELDAEHFEQLARSGNDALASGNHAAAADLLAEALALWRGPALADFRYDAFAQAEAGRLEELRLVCLEDRIEAELALGRHATAVGELEALVVEEPLRERLRAQLILALYRSGRQSEALAQYQATRRMLADELGLEPTPELRELERMILAHDASLAPPPSRGKELLGGTITFLFTDIEGSTTLLRRLGRERYGGLLARHETLLREAFAAHQGEEVDTQGDAFFVAFRGAADAVSAAIAIQRSLADHEWPEGTTVRVRVGIHSGEASAAGERYVGLSVHRAARIGDAGHGGQILLSDATRVLVEDDLPAGVHLRDLGAYHLKDVDRPERIFQVAAEGLQVEFAPLRGTRPSNLPLQLTPFIGRRREVAELVELIRGGSRRLVTLTGPGGSGKSRLAAEAAAQLAGDYPDGVWWVPLQSLTDSRLVAPTIADSIGAKDDIAASIATRQMLVVLDNFEQLLPARSDVAAILGDCANLHLLVTSREPLNVAAEREYRVPPMTETDAVALFDERAVRSGSEKTRADVCRRLDCLPLAVELAAARTKVFTLEQILSRLDDRLSFLRGGPHDAPARQQTLRATIDWSYDLLLPEEQRVLEELSVFAGSWGLAGAAAVCRFDDDGALVDSVMSLIEKSLVVRSEDAGEEPRYAMLETIRSYAIDRLQARGALRDVQRRHAEHLLSFVEHGAWTGDEVPDFEVDHESVREELPNLRGALSFSVEEGDLDLALRLAGAGSRAFGRIGAFVEARAWMTRVLALTRDLLTPDRARTLLDLGECEMVLGNPCAAADRYEEARVLFERCGDKRGVLLALTFLIELAAETHDPDGESLLPMAQALANEAGNDYIRARLLLAGAGIETRSGEFERADAMLDEGLKLMRNLGVPGRIWAWQLMNVGWLALKRRDLPRARSAFEEYLAETSAKHPIGTANAHCNLGLVALYEHEREAAAEQFGQALVIARETEAKMLLAECLHGMAAVAAMDGDLEGACRLWGAAGSLKEVTSLPLSIPEQFIVEQYLGPAQAVLAPDVRAAAKAGGAALSLDAAIAYALGETG